MSYGYNTKFLAIGVRRDGRWPGGEGFMYYNKKARMVIAMIGLCAVVTTGVLFAMDRTKYTSVQPSSIDTIVVDPGHGGADGGAVGYNNIVEKDINLHIAQKLRDMLIASGFKVVMTRDADVMINDDDAMNLTQKKKSDMHNRLKIMQDNPNSLTISVHQNKFEQSQYSGAQMFYGPKNPQSQILGSCIQKAFVDNLQKDNTRQIKKAQKDLYLLYHAQTPSVLVECGFLSNPEESKLLIDDTYQNKVAFTIMSGILNYLKGEQPEQSAT